ncbi:serine hydrolase [Deinococcus sp. Arct2-2]|uniref:serine hydrolase n=1 Tax=Deinococcus sp. Arct2-2 TaxID=2568653 RepID=UPI0010A388D3|nr:serine hydrolase [Deinococcus sp. Arct2-2]THF67867.1 serine hydrolase [Deinococcus sp. Arct2-2]
MKITHRTALPLALTSFAAVALGATAFTQRRATDQTTAKIDSYLRAQLASGRFMGSVLVVRGDKIILKQGYGSANLEFSAANTPDTVFRIGSLTKQFTAAAVLQLQERGLLDVKNTLDTYLPDYPQGERITLHQLLTHTAGLPEVLERPEVADGRRTFTLDELISTFQNLPLKFAPGSQFQYSNSGYVLLTKVIEVVSGQSYASYLDQHIFLPLKMTHTAYDDVRPTVNNRASGYVYGGRTYSNANFVDLSIPVGAGALRSTLEDLQLWERALENGRVLRPLSRKAMITPHARFKLAGADATYGYGQFLTVQRGRGAIEHNGGIDGFSSALSTYPAEGLVVIVLSNVQDLPALEVAHTLASIVFGEPYELPKVRGAIDIAPAELQRYVGRYQGAEDFDVTVLLRGGQLFAVPAGGAEIALFASAKNEFFLKALDAQVTFRTDQNGTVTGLVFDDAESGAPPVSARKAK